MDIKVRRPVSVRPSAKKQKPQPSASVNTAWYHRLHLWPRSWSKRRRWVCTSLLLIGIAVMVGGGSYFWNKNHQPATKPKAVVVVKPAPAPPAPTTVASKLTGLQTDPAAAQRAVTGIMIENSPDARPQSGLLQAGVVYEAVAEGGITRFLALFQEAQPTYIGPVRSSRPYYLDWLLPFDAAYAHAGGSPAALAQIKQLGIKDLDQFANGGAYHRVSQRYAPHNLYTSMADLDALEKQKGYTSSNFTGFPRKAEAPSAAPSVRSIDLTISSYLYNPHFDYNAATNSYNRSEGGKPHIDEKSGTQLSPKVVIALVTPSKLDPDGTHNSYATTGSGPMYVFQDGVYQQGTWHKDTRNSQFVFTDSNGQTLKLNPGQTWISFVNTVPAVQYKQ